MIFFLSTDKINGTVKNVIANHISENFIKYGSLLIKNYTHITHNDLFDVSLS